jgi:phosphoribosylpyrophosphate synthetase
MLESPGLLLFSPDADTAFFSNLAAQLGVAPAPHEHRVFEDGECKLRPLSDPRGRDAYVVHSLFGDAQHSPHDKLFGLLAFIATLFDHGAARVTAVGPTWLTPARTGKPSPLIRCLKMISTSRQDLPCWTSAAVPDW